jgi:hypothetical protein
VLADQPAHRFEFAFTPTHGSWLSTSLRASSPNLLAQSCAHIRAESKRELKDRIVAAMDYFNADPVVHSWAYKLEKAA